MYLCAATDAIWPRTRLAEAGYEIDPMCEKCGQEPDTLHHRIWKCQDSACRAARQEVAPNWLVSEAIRAGQSSLFYNCGLMANAADLMRGPTELAESKFHRSGAEMDSEADWNLQCHVY